MVLYQIRIPFGFEWTWDLSEKSFNTSLITSVLDDTWKTKTRFILPIGGEGNSFLVPPGSSKPPLRHLMSVHKASLKFHISSASSRRCYKVCGRHRCPILLMEEILHQLIGSLLSHYLQGFIHPRWCRIFSINSKILPLTSYVSC